MSKLSKRAIAMLIEAPVEVKLYNGCFNVAHAQATFTKYSLELRVEVTHPLLEWQCGNKKEVTLYLWKGCNGYPVMLPDVLLAKVDELRIKAAMTDDEAKRISAENMRSIEAMHKELGFCH